MLAATQGELDSLKLICSRARYLGMETEMITLDEAVELNPLIDKQHFIGALWRADGGHCDPSGTTHAYVKAARKLGASVERFTRVLELNPRADGTWDVVTDKGTVHAEHVVNCAGTLGARSRADGRHPVAGARDGAPLPADRGHPGAQGPVAGNREHHRLCRRDLHAPGARRCADRHLRAARQGLVAGEDAGRLLDAAAAGRVRAAGAVLRGRLRAFPGARPCGHPQGDQRSLHVCTRRQSARRAGARAAQLLGGLRRDGGIQPGRRHRPRAVALDGGRRSGPGHPLDGRRALRALRHAEVHVAQGARELRSSLSPGVSQRGTAGRQARCVARRSTTELLGCRRRHGRQLRSRARVVVCAAGRGADRDPDVPSIRGISGRARGMSRGAPHCRTLRNEQLRQVRGQRPRRARLARQGVCMPHSRGPDASASRRC